MATTITAPVDESMPWTNWPDVRTARADISSLRVDHSDEIGGLILRGTESESEQIREFGVVDRSAFVEFGRLIGFPSQFLLEKVSPSLAAQVVNERIQAQRPNQWAMALEDSENMLVTAIVPGHRVSANNRDIAQTAWASIVDNYGGEGLKIIQASQHRGAMQLIVETPKQTLITPAEGDVLKARVVVTHTPLQELNSYVAAMRLFCANGASSPAEEWTWSRSTATPEEQLQFVHDSIGTGLIEFDRLAARSQEMAATRISGDPVSALQARMRALGIPARHWDGILEAFNAEPGDTEWAMVNALTRYATHSPELTSEQASRYQAAAGSWVSGFEIVSARLPRPLANRIGAQIIN